MGENWFGFSGSYPFGSVAYAGALCESARFGADAHPASSSAATTPAKAINFFRLNLISLPLKVSIWNSLATALRFYAKKRRIPCDVIGAAAAERAQRQPAL
jgi:hypothetical protein